VTAQPHVTEPLEIAGIRAHLGEPERRDRRSWLGTAALAIAALAVPVSVGALVVALRAHPGAVGPGRWVVFALVVVWCGAATVCASNRPGEPLGWILLGVGAATVVAMTGASELARAPGSDVAAALRAGGLAAAMAVALHLSLGLPDGRLRTNTRRAAAAAGYVGGAMVALVLFGDRPSLPRAPLWAFAGVAAVVALVAFVARCRGAATIVERARLQWPAWGVVVAMVVTGGAVVLHSLLSWPESLTAIAVASSALVPIALALGSSARVAVRVDRLLVHTITLAGLAGLLGACYLLVVLGLGRSPRSDERTILGLSLLAAAFAAVLWVPTRERLEEYATRRVYGERHAPDEVLRTFGSRLTRALPFDELLLQLAESLKATLALDAAEVWTRTAGRLERAVSVPDRGAATIALAPAEELVVARAGVSGPAWAQVWLPALVPSVAEPVLRVAPVTNSGELLGVIVVRRPVGAAAFSEADDQALTELARQVGLALHNVKLDSALQESLDEVRRQADELRASRTRIVEATDTERRRIERDLHDGAQQHLVALAVSVRLARQVADSDPEQAKAMLEQIGVDLQDAVQVLRELAHGIYPPLLMDRGLPAALGAAGDRAALATVVDADGVGRYPQQVEAAVYFCCLEALQNAGKHAGDDATVTISLREEQSALLFDVSDDGTGFDMASGAQRGHGFVNMSDRVGAFGGSMNVDSAPGRGTRIAGRIPLAG
jgi:signal transduction histidine kinase